MATSSRPAPAYIAESKTTIPVSISDGELDLQALSVKHVLEETKEVLAWIIEAQPQPGPTEVAESKLSSDMAVTILYYQANKDMTNKHGGLFGAMKYVWDHAGDHGFNPKAFAHFDEKNLAEIRNVKPDSDGDYLYEGIKLNKAKIIAPICYQSPKHLKSTQLKQLLNRAKEKNITSVSFYLGLGNERSSAKDKKEARDKWVRENQDNFISGVSNILKRETLEKEEAFQQASGLVEKLYAENEEFHRIVQSDAAEYLKYIKKKNSPRQDAVSSSSTAVMQGKFSLSAEDTAMADFHHTSTDAKEELGNTNADGKKRKNSPRQNTPVEPLPTSIRAIVTDDYKNLMRGMLLASSFEVDDAKAAAAAKGISQSLIDLLSKAPAGTEDVLMNVHAMLLSKALNIGGSQKKSTDSLTVSLSTSASASSSSKRKSP